MKISIIGGAGRVGSSTAFVLQLMGLGSDIALVDVNAQGAAGEALDLLHGSAFTSAQRIVSGGMEFVEGSDIVIVTAGLRRKPDESRLDLINRNAKLFSGIMDDLREAPLPAESTLLVVTNPVDILTYLAVERSGFPPDRVLGLGTVLDSLRFRSLLADHFRADPTQVAALILGEHGDSMVPIWSTAAVNGVPLTSHPAYDQQAAMRLFERTRQSGAEILQLKGGAGYAVGVAVAEVVKAVVLDTQSLQPVSTLQHGIYGIRDVCLSVPTRLGRSGVGEKLEMSLWPKEQAALEHSAESLKATLKTIEGP